MLEFQYHRTQQTLHVGCERPHAYLIPYQSDAAADSGNRALSDRFLSLCGEWSFRYYDALYKVPDFTASDRTTDGAERLTVPMSWQMALGRGYDVPHYTNINYPIPLDPPNVPEDNPCGLYERQFEINAETLAAREVRMVFEGVDSCFYLYINHRFVAYSQVSHTTSEVILNDYLVAGQNTVQVLVLKWCDGTYLEDQDKLRLSGIFREVYLLLREKIHPEDLYVRGEVSEDLHHATVRAELTLNGTADVLYRLMSPDDVQVACGTVRAEDGTATITIPIETPTLWSDETPRLYRLYLTCGDEHIRQEIGLRRFEVKGRVLYVNGQKVKGKGVNRHDSHPRLGAATPMDHILRDLYIMKAHNINMVRTSHYPNDPRFLELCDRLGFYVCDEADLETHGFGVDAGDWGELTKSAAWAESYLDRAERMMERDKNHACILMWSVGNESGDGENHRLMADYFHRRMPGCIVHSHDASLQALRDYQEAEKHGKKLPTISQDYIDIDSGMYVSPEDIEKYYLKLPVAKKPFFQCEYSHAMGNGPGDLEAYWQQIYANDCFFGGCVWELLDHSVDVGTIAEPHYLYGGDMGTFPHDGNFCVDGLLYPDRRPHMGIRELKQVLRPCRATGFDAEKGTVTLHNLRYFTSLSDLDLYWTVERNGEVIRQGRVTELQIAPQHRRTYSLKWNEGEALNGFCYLNLYYRTNTATPWADAGYEVGFEQFELQTEPMPVVQCAPMKRTFAVCEESARIIVTDGDCVYTIDRIRGLLSSVVGNGKELLSAPVTPTIWRAPTDNDRTVKERWYGQSYHKMQVHCRDCRTETAEAETIVVKATLILAAPARRPLLEIDVQYRFVRGQGVEMVQDVHVKREKAFLPRFGVVFQMPSDYEQLAYFGRGSAESYVDKKQASRVSRYATTVTEHFEHNIRPQENMAHTETRWVQVGSLAGHGLLALNTEFCPSFSFNCSHFTAQQLTETAHDFELKPLQETVVHLDYRQSGIGSNSCGPDLPEALRLNETEFRFAVRLLPVLTNDVCPFEKTVR